MWLKATSECWKGDYQVKLNAWGAKEKMRSGGRRNNKWADGRNIDGVAERAVE